MQGDDETIAVLTLVRKNDLWIGVFGAGIDDFEWWVDFEFEHGRLENHGVATVLALDPNGKSGYETIAKAINVADLATAWNALATSGFAHCGGETLSDADDLDVCVADAVLQQAVFGEQVYS